MSHMQMQQPMAFQPIPQQHMTPGLPHRPPFVAPIDSLPEMQQHAPHITGLVMHEVQTKANANPARQLLFFAATQSQWQNQYFLKLVSEVADYAAYIIFANQNRVAAYNAIQQATVELCGMHTSVLACGHPGVMSMLPANIQQDINQKAMAYRNVAATIGQFMQSRMNGMQTLGATVGGGFPQQQQPVNTMHNQIPVTHLPGGGGFQGFGGFQQPQQQQFAQPQQRNGGIATIAGDSRFPVNTNNGGLGTKMGSSLTAARPLSDESVVEEVKQPQPEPAKAMLVTHFAPTPIEQPKPVITPKENVVMSEVQPNATAAKINIDADGRFQMEGDTYILSTKYKAPLSNAKGAGWCSAYDPAKHVVGYVVEGGKVNKVRGFPKEMFAVEPYEKHETVHFLRSRPQIENKGNGDYELARKAFTESVQAADIAALIKEREADADHVEGNIVLDVPVVLTDSIILDVNTTNYRGLAESWLTDPTRNLTWNREQTLRFRYAVRRSGHLSVDAALLLQSFKEIVSWEGLQHHLHRLRAALTSNDWNIINEDLTKAVNSLVDIQMSLDLFIDSFSDDILDLKQHIVTNFGETIGETFDKAAATIAKQCVVATTETKNDTENYLAANFEEICLLNVHANDLTVRYEGKAGVVLERRFPEFHAFLKDLLENPVQHKPTRATKIVTLDGQVFSVHRSAFDSATILITTMYL